MDICIIIRGPAGVGKTTIAKRLAKHLKAYYVSYDRIIKRNKLDKVVGGGIPSGNFIKANELIIPTITKKKKVILDGCFYRKRQITHLQKKITPKLQIFTLDANITECIKRNKKRKNPMTTDNIKQVHKLVSKVQIGINISTTNKTIQEIVNRIINTIKS